MMLASGPSSANSDSAAAASVIATPGRTGSPRSAAKVRAATLSPRVRRTDGQGYYTAYKGKWHLSDEFETANKLHMPKRILVEEMEEYGFSDYFGIGDMIAHTEGGFVHDGVIEAMVKSWLRGKASSLAAENQPWFMAVNFVNPHDVMYYNTDLPEGPARQASTAPAVRVAGELRPGHPIVVGRSLLEGLPEMGPDTPLRQLRGGAEPLWTVAVDSRTILDDLDTPEDLKTIRTRLAGEP